MGSALIDRRTARLAVALAVAGSLMLTAGLGIWAVSALSHAIPHSAHTAAWLAAVALLTAGVSCGVLMIVVLLGSGSRNGGPAEPSWRDPRLHDPHPPGGQVPGPPRPGPGLPPTGLPPTGLPPTGLPAHPGPAGPPDPGRPPEGGQPSGGWSPGGWPAADPDHRLDAGPELDWPEPPAAPEPDVVAGEWSGPAVPHAQPAPTDWAGAEPGIAPDVEPAAYEWSAPDGGFVPQPEPAADDWSGADAELRPGAVLGQAEWIVREDESEAGPEPGADAGPLPAESAPSPAAGRPAGDDPDDGPVHRVESAFNVWGRPGPDAEPAAPASDVAPPDAVLPDAGLPDPALPDTGLPDTGLPDPALPDTGLPDAGLPDTVLPDTGLPDSGLPGVALPDVAVRSQPASSAPTTRDCVQHAAARLRDADLRPGADRQPDAGLQPAGGLPPPVHEVSAEPAADILEPVDDLADQDLIRRPPAPRRSGPAPGWNPDSEEDWLRVLRGLRAPEDG